MDHELTMPPTDAAGEPTLGPRPGELSKNGTHYRLDGPSSSPLVVLQNGIFDPPTRFDFMSEALVAAGYRTLRYDSYGRSWSKAPAGFRFTAAEHVAQLAALLDELALKPSAIVAHSAGAIIAMRFAEQCESVTALVLLAPAGAMAAPLPCFRTLQRLFGLCGGCGVALVGALMAGSPPEDYSHAADDERVARLARWDRAWHTAQARANGTRALAASVVRLPLVSLKLRGVLKGRGVRVLVLTGKDDAQVRGVRRDFYAAAFGEAAATLDPPCAGGHCFFVQSAAAVQPRVVEFLKRKLFVQSAAEA